jgi:hypothetical protein
MRTLVAAICLALLNPQMACAGDTQEASKQLRQAELRWQNQAPKNYSLTVSHSKFVSEYGCEIQSFEVKGSRSSPSNTANCKTRPDKFGSVPALLRLARKLLAQKPDEAIFEFDHIYGYPKKIYVGSSTLEDVYFMYQVTEFSVPDTSSNP